METIRTALPYEGVMSTAIGGRKENQDSCGYIETPRGLLLVVCDGMGGGPSGKTASMIAATAILEFMKENVLPENNTVESIPEEDETANKSVESASKTVPATDEEMLVAAVKYGNQAMRQAIQENPALDGMGTTVVALLLNDRQATIVHVGDSRLYQLRGKDIVFRTADHSQVGELVRAGAITEEQARLSANSNIITRALGVGDVVDVDVDVRPYETGDLFVLCTDGIWGAMPQKDLLDIFLNNSRSIQGCLDVLNLKVENAGIEKGGHHDNYTAILLKTKTNSTLKETMSKKIKLTLRVLAVACALSILLNIIFLCIGVGGHGSDNKSVIDSTKNQEYANDTINKYRSDIDLLNQQINLLKDSIINIKSKSKNATQSSPVHDVASGYDAHSNESLETAKSDLANIITDIKTLGPMTDVNEKKTKRDEILRRLESIKDKFSESHQEIISAQISMLKKGVTVELDDAKTKRSSGHCNNVADKLEKILK